MYYSFTLDGTSGFLAILGVLFVLTIIPVIIAMVLSAAVRRRAETVLRQRTGTVVVDYEAPRGLSPAEVGLLYDSKCGEKEMRATLFDLAQKGVIRCRQSAR